MNVQELTESLHATSVHTPLDLDRVTRDGRRIRTRRRTALAGGLALALAAVAVPVSLWQQEAREDQYAGSPAAQAGRQQARGEQRAEQFRAQAPVAQPSGAVVMAERRFDPAGQVNGNTEIILRAGDWPA